jgi:hypothetical protein
MNPLKKLFGRPAPTSNTRTATVMLDGEAIAVAPVTPSVSPVVTIYSLFNTFSALLGVPTSLSLRATEDADIGHVTLEGGDTLYVRFRRNARQTEVTISDGQEYVTVVIR